MKDTDRVILLTGAAGFIGSYLLGWLNREGYSNIIIVDDFSVSEKTSNYSTKKFIEKVDRKDLFKWLEHKKINTGPTPIKFVFHLGARTDTAEFDYAVLEQLNLDYSKKIWNYCTENNIPLVYASSAATYGGGEYGYRDDHDLPEKLKPLNPYGISKNEFDKWALQQISAPPEWVGLKFFNVYGPNEYHKGRMASVVYHAFNQIKTTGKVKLFRSHKTEYKDGQQLRDFIYVEDVVKVCCWLMQNHISSGLYNLGTGKARTFEDLVKATFAATGTRPHIEYIDIPEDIRNKYQYFTEADMRKLIRSGYGEKFLSLEEGIAGYVKNFLVKEAYY